MLFNKNDNGSQEIYELTGSYYANNDFKRIKAEIDLAKDEVAKIISDAVMLKIESAYSTYPDSPTDEDKKYKALIEYAQLPVAILAALRMYQKNDISHEQDGRKVKIDSETEKLPWEWQLKRDDEQQLDMHYRAIDRLIQKLDQENPAEWQASSQKTLSKAMLIRTADDFDMYYPINKSSRLYMILLPFMKDAQRRFVKPALGPDFDILLAGQDLTDKQKDVLELACLSLALYTIAIAIRRLPLGIIPLGVIRSYSSAAGSESSPANMEEIKTIAKWMEKDAAEVLNDMKKARTEIPADIDLLPTNDVNNKFCRL